MYDIRGSVDTDITPGFVERVGEAFGTYLRQIYSVRPRVAVGRDNRASSPELHAAVCEGLLDRGCDVVNIGLSTTPLLCYAIADWHLDGGVNITGSHNPPGQNGLKLEARNAYPVAEQEIQYLRKMVENRSFFRNRERGNMSAADCSGDYFSRLRQIVRLERPLKVVVDTGNGVAGLFAPKLLEMIGCTVVPLFCDLDSSFPNHWPNPENPDNMKALQRTVIDEQADIGFAFDGDGDRLGAVDEKGNLFNADSLIILLSRDLLKRHPGAKILIDVKSSQNVIEDIYNHEGEPVLWKTGHSLIRRKMISEEILLAGEFSGHIFPAEDYYPVSDALLAALRVLQIVSGAEHPLSELLSDLRPLYSTGLIELDCPDNYKFEAVERARKSLARHYDVITVDGVRVCMPHGWALIRASNTSESLTLRFEADSPRRLEEIMSTVFHRLQEFPFLRNNIVKNLK
jgi:phosphomannomutase/phosphoglucomutase